MMNAIWHLGQLAILVTALSMAWWIHYQADFFYRLWYEAIGIEETIERYAPQNRYKRFFADTDKEQRLRVFTAINHGVHARAEGLADIRYTTLNGYSDTLLHEAEVTHLQDVAALLERLKAVAVAAAIVTLLLLGWLWRRRPSLPAPGRTWLVLLAATGILGTTVLILGPTRVFYRFHIWLFPPDHQWFFYYQDSLMSTLMKAPDLFGAIGASLCAMAVVIYMALSWSLWRWLGRGRKPKYGSPDVADYL